MSLKGKVIGWEAYRNVLGDYSIKLYYKDHTETISSQSPIYVTSDYEKDRSCKMKRS